MQRELTSRAPNLLHFNASLGQNPVSFHFVFVVAKRLYLVSFACLPSSHPYLWCTCSPWVIPRANKLPVVFFLGGPLVSSVAPMWAPLSLKLLATKRDCELSEVWLAPYGNWLHRVSIPTCLVWFLFWRF